MSIVYNNVIARINDDEFNLTGLIQSINYDTGTMSEHVQCLDPNGKPNTINRINKSPSGSINFVSADGLQLWYTFMNGSDKFSLTFEEYVTGNLAGTSHTVIIPEAMTDGNSGSSSAMSPANNKTFRFKAIDIQQ